MDAEGHTLAEQVEELSPLAELWESAVERALRGALPQRDILASVERDVALTTRVLAVANSEPYGKPEQIATLPAAVEYLGLDMVQNLVLSTPCEEASRQALYGQRIEFGEFWRHCLACSILSERIAAAALPALAREAKVAGLLHDVGKLLLNRALAEACSLIVPERGQRALQLQELEHLKRTHAEAGFEVFERLRLPVLLRVACGRHHHAWEDLDLGDEADLMAACVSLADFLSYQLELGSGGNHARLMESPPKVSRLGLSEADLQAIQASAQREYQEVLGEIHPGTSRLGRQFQLLRQVAQVLGRRSLYLNKNVTELSRLQEIHEDLNHSLGIEELAGQVAVRLGTIFPAEVIAFLLFLEEGPRIYYFSKLPLADAFVRQSRAHLFENLAPSQREELESLECEIELLVPDATEGRFQLKEVRSALGLPLQGREGQVGRLAFFSGVSHAFSRSEEDLIAIIAGEIALALDRANWMRRTELLSITDELTGLYNHREFLKLLAQEFGRSKRYKSSLCLLMVDIDHFKALNDAYGHPQGDRVLRELARIFREATRESDMLTRYGGEEFALILPSTDLAGGQVTAERIRQAVETCAFPYPGNPPLHTTVSVGVAHYQGEGLEHPKEFIELADRALYQAKRQGRNRTVVAGQG